MDPCNVYTWNPLAPDWLNGLEAEEVGTPAGYVDLYSEFNFDMLLPHNSLDDTRRLSFDTDFLILGTLVWSDQPGNEEKWNVRFRGPDGEAIQNTRLVYQMVGGSRGNAKPWLTPQWVPLGKFIGIEIESPASDATDINLQITFCGLRRWKMAGVKVA